MEMIVKTQKIVSHILNSWIYNSRSISIVRLVDTQRNLRAVAWFTLPRFVRAWHYGIIRDQFIPNLHPLEKTFLINIQSIHLDVISSASQIPCWVHVVDCVFVSFWQRLCFSLNSEQHSRKYATLSRITSEGVREDSEHLKPELFKFPNMSCNEIRFQPGTSPWRKYIITFDILTHMPHYLRF